AINPTKGMEVVTTTGNGAAGGSVSTQHRGGHKSDTTAGKRISLKVMTLNNDKQKVNDKLGNPVEIGVVVIWKVVNTAQAVFDVDNYMEFLSIQADSALRNIVRMYPYDICDDGENQGELSLRGSSLEVAQRLKEELQEKVGVAGLEIVETKITHLAYAPEIAAAMLQRQQASAIVDARKLIVEGAVGMVQMALTQLSDEKIVELDDERKAAMVSNLLVVLCGNRDAQPIVNSGSIY
ncbi:MAG: SPFH domain-containing protein, partial [Oscillibacter sp.]